jgi:hypothetical protein
VNGSLTAPMTFAANGLAGQVVVNAGNFSGANWLGTVTIGSQVLSPLPNYSQQASALGGGAIGLVPFRLHGQDCVPIDQSTVTTGFLPGNSVVLRHYGPVEWASTNPAEQRLIVERSESGGPWVDIRSTLVYTISSSNPRELIITSFNPTVAFDNPYDYRVRHTGQLRCRTTEVPGNVPVAGYTYTVFMR